MTGVKLGLCLACAFVLLWGAVPAAAVVPLTSPPLPARVALADLIALGKVTAVEDDWVVAAPLVKIPGVTKKVPFRIAVVSIQSPIVGAEKLERARRLLSAPGCRLAHPWRREAGTRPPRRWRRGLPFPA
jgi:hypothetical protein